MVEPSTSVIFIFESYKASTSYSCNSHIEILMLKLLPATLLTVHGDNKVVDKEFVVLA